MQLNKNRSESIWNFFHKVSQVEGFVAADKPESENVKFKLKDVPKRSAEYFSYIKTLFGVALGKFKYDRKQLGRVAVHLVKLFSFVKTWFVHALVLRVTDKSLPLEEQYKLLNDFVKRLQDAMRNTFFKVYLPSKLLRSLSLQELKDSVEARSSARVDPINFIAKIEVTENGVHLHLLFFSVFRQNVLFFVKLCKMLAKGLLTVSVQQTPEDQKRPSFGAAGGNAKTFADALRMAAYLCKEDGREQLEGNNRMMFTFLGSLEKELARSGKELKDPMELVADAEAVEAGREQFQLKVMSDDFFGIRKCNALRRCTLGKFGKPRASGKLLDDDEIRDEPQVELERSIWQSIKLLPGMFGRLFKKVLKLVGVKLSGWWLEASSALEEKFGKRNPECQLN